MRIKHYIYSILFLFISTILSAKDHQDIYADKLFSIDEGLSQSHITCIIQDSLGYIWIGTRDGLNKYDGYEFINYRYQPGDTNSISDNYINAICEGRNGDIWIATNGGLNVYDRDQGKFINYHFSEVLNEDEVIYSVYMDKLGIIWLKTATELIKFNSLSHKISSFKHYDNPFSFVNSISCFPLFEDSKGLLWVGTKDGLNYFDKELELFKSFYFEENNIKSISNNYIKCIYEDKKGNVWIGTQNGLNIFNRESKLFLRYTVLSNDNDINVIFEDNRNNLLVGTTKGLYRLEESTNTFRNISKFNVNGKQVVISSVFSILIDKTDIFWLGTTEGLLKYNSKGKKFKSYKSYSTNASIIDQNEVSTIMVDDDKSIWVGSWNDGIRIIKNQNDVFINKDNSILPDNTISKIFKDSRNRIWIGTANYIVLYLKNDFNLASKIYADFKLDFFYNNRVNDITEDKEGNIWFATNRGIVRFGNNNQIRIFNKLFYNNIEIHLSNVYSIEFDKEGFLWIGTENGLVKYFPANGFCNVFKKDRITQTENSLISNNVYTLLDADSILWIGTDYGLNKLNKNSEKFKLYSIKDGFPNSVIHSIEFDKEGNLWIGTSKGLLSYNREKNLIKKYELSDGLDSYEFINNCSFKTKNGELFFGGISGFNSFYPDSLIKNINIPEIVITSIEEIDLSGTKVIKPEIIDQIIIDPDIRMFTINFAALDFTNPHKNRFSYKISKEGTQSDWIDIGNYHFVNFTNLSPGKYTFKVKGSNNDLEWNTTGKEIEIIVKAYFYKTKVAYYSYFLLFVFFIFLFIRNRTEKLKVTKKLLIEKENAANEIAIQKEKLTVINKDITDSINYAKRIQEAMMPSIDLFRKLFSDSFVYYKPKSIVSGDFYWINENNNKIFVAAVDCTGHGVPGAFMSLIGIELFRRITHIREIDQPSQILNILNENFQKIFSDVSNVSLKDGMDVALCVIDKKKMMMEFAGAFNSLYIIRDYKIIEIKGDRFSVGLFEKEMESDTIGLFQNQQIKLESDDVIYLSTDGYVDQFGGQSGKKYKKRRYRHLLLNIHKYPMDKQMEMIDKSFEEWKGQSDQIDDILVIGIKP